MEAASDQQPIKRKKSSGGTRHEPHRVAAISMLPPDDGGITCDSCDKDIKHVSGWRGRGEERGCWRSINATIFGSLLSLCLECQKVGFDNGRRPSAAVALTCVCVHCELVASARDERAPRNKTCPDFQEAFFRCCWCSVLSVVVALGGACAANWLCRRFIERLTCSIPPTLHVQLG